MYDYVIIGAGSAGCVLANRLSEDPNNSVCVLEAGPSDRLEFIHTPGAFGLLMFTKKYDWSYDAKPDPRLRHGQPIFCPRGKTLGGSSSINGMLYVRGNSSEYDRWAQLGGDGWSYDEVLPYFKRAECNQRGGDAYHGGSGPLYVSNSELQYTITKVFIEAAKQAGLPYNDDFNGANPEGFGPYQFTIKDGRRWSTAVAYLHPVMERKNLTVITGAEVSKLVLDGGHVVGVTYDHHGERKTVQASKEVILSAGTYNSPKLMMLSGIGDPAELKAHGLAAAHALPGVGKNLQEHADAAILTTSHFHGGVQLSLRGMLQMVGEGAEYYGADMGKLRASLTEAGGFLKTDASLRDPDVQFHSLPLLFDDSGRDLRLMSHDGYSCHVCVLHPKSRGTVGLASADPAAAPVIDHNFFDHPEDIKTLVAGVRLGRRILAAPAFDKYRKEEIHPGPDKQSDDAIAAACREKLGIVYHPVGTCKMGKDDMAVVDPHLRVRGLQGLRIVDASIMPTLTGGNTNAPTIMIAEKASDMILGR
jgi:choline dehydrogenase